MAKSNARRLIRESRIALRELMMVSLSKIASNVIEDVMKNYRNSIPSQQINATKGVATRGMNEYKAELKEALAVIAREAIEDAKKEIPNGKKIKFSELDRLAPEVAKRVLNQSELLVGKQLADLKSKIFFQFSSSQASTDSESTIEKDLQDAGDDFIEGVSVTAGASASASTIVNESRSAFFYQDDTLEEIEAFQFVNDSPVTDICEDLNGSIFAKDDPDADRYRPPLHWNAVLENSFIKTYKCQVKIQDIKIGDMVFTHNGNYKKVLKTMSKFEDKEYFILELENGKNLSLTGEHPVLTKNRGWIRCDELNLTDDIVCVEDV